MLCKIFSSIWHNVKLKLFFFNFQKIHRDGWGRLEPMVSSSSSNSTPTTVVTWENLLLSRPKVREGESLEARSNKLEYGLETVVI